VNRQVKDLAQGYVTLGEEHPATESKLGVHARGAVDLPRPAMDGADAYPGAASGNSRRSSGVRTNAM
jgi:hypothetical protein